MNRIQTVSLFTGCGGGDLGAKAAGADIIYALDINKDSINTYRKYAKYITIPNPLILKEDISNITAFPKCELLIGCYPCQSFTMGGKRSPSNDPRTMLYYHFGRAISSSNPIFFVTENVSGLVWLDRGKYLKEHCEYFSKCGKGYNISFELINAKDYGVPQDRKRVFIVGVRKDISLYYWFPLHTHGPGTNGLPKWKSHGEAIKHFPINAEGEYYHYPKEPFSWWYLSRNRKRKWDDPSYAIQANWRHNPLHPASPTMYLVESNLEDGFKQKWEFTNHYEHIENNPERPVLQLPRRLTWRECGAIQTFPTYFEPEGSISSKYEQIGNATPPLLMEQILKGIVQSTSLFSKPYSSKSLILT